jgi:hypothetical protein
MVPPCSAIPAAKGAAGNRLSCGYSVKYNGGSAGALFSCADVAQLVEQALRKRHVAGSSPAIGSMASVDGALNGCRLFLKADRGYWVSVRRTIRRASSPRVPFGRPWMSPDDVATPPLDRILSDVCLWSGRVFVQFHAYPVQTGEHALASVVRVAQPLRSRHLRSRPGIVIDPVARDVAGKRRPGKVQSRPSCDS